jgi:predicted aspartyl protease
MGIVYIDGLVAGSAGQQETVRFLVDSGATYTLLPNDTWRALGLSPKANDDLQSGRWDAPRA